MALWYVRILCHVDYRSPTVPLQGSVYKFNIISGTWTDITPVSGGES